ncbi:acylneuraminate cytidylyltransferase [Salinimicrobium marinum]|uniref:Acylneuraminate cytidylyltransferase n=1 Tax=Salinimicrobium marinum TaxID=680283 RepID=A0A918VVV2_9FLAO|nr:SGNH/GDSL hydrolase family protein [Salinimicrobium marinum]GHA27794.1 acylneuraminate cytidylyltransferase [Salinimicrobium marinum]
MKKSLFLLLILATGMVYSQESDFDKLMKQDWANLQKYRAENAKIKGNSSGDLVVFMGNSITENWVWRHPEFFSENNYVGRGISGQTTPQMLIRFTPDVIDLNPKAVVILAGTNDIAGNTGSSTVKMITDNIEAMVQLAVANDIKVILASVLPVYKYPWREQIDPVEKITEVNQWLENYAHENGYVYLDFYSAMVDDKKGLKDAYGEDGVHPVKEGYLVMEPLAKAAIAKALGKKE